tara:strand:+ start:3847 stop:4527 length:681 start_codon:yes stop_codon:yes gene_type:complete
MISAKQLSKVLAVSFSGGSSFMAPTSTFIATPASYSVSAAPASVTLTGTITPNNGTDITWTITNGVGTIIAVGTGNVVSHTLAAVSTTVGTDTYNLNVSYKDLTLATLSMVVTTSVLITTAAMIGQLSNPTDVITTPAELTPAFEALLTVTDQATIINVFDLVAAFTGRLVFVLPDSYGTLTAIEDGSGLDVSTQFNTVVDASNNRVIYISINVVTPATYNYKIVY